jgi:TonB family protein
MVTQTLSPGSTATERNAAGVRPQAQKQKQPPVLSVPQSSGATFPAHTGAPGSSHDTILVGAPAVGAPPARVILETEPLSASSKVAVTASRSILVPGSSHPTEQLLLGKLVSYVHPVYPADALAKDIEGTVRVRLFIGPSGKVRSVRLLSGPAALAPAAMSAIREWRYDSTLLNGHPIESQADVSVFFRLH